MASSDAFESLFSRWSARVRRRFTLRYLLAGAAIGACASVLASIAAWYTYHETWRPWFATTCLMGAIGGLVVAKKRIWNNSDVALYLDAKLGTAEVIASALDERIKPQDAEESSAASWVRDRAVETLSKADPKKARLRVIYPWAVSIPIALAAVGYISWMPARPLPMVATLPPGVDNVQIAEIAGLEKVVRLAELDARDEDQRKRLQKISEDAKKLREKLRNGMEKREALSEIAKLRDAVTKERSAFGSGEERKGLESAIRSMEGNSDLKNAAKALGDRDLVAFDEEMEKLANQLEQKDREKAKQALEEAIENAKKEGAKDVAKALEQEKKKLEKKGDELDKLKELSKALEGGLSDEQKELLQDSGKPGGKSAQKMAENLEKALESLSPEERKKLAEKLKKQANEMPDGPQGMPPSKQKMKELAEQLETKEGQEQLREQLKKMASEPDPGSDESKRQQGLNDAERGLGDAEGQLGNTPMPMPVPGQGENSGKGPSPKSSGTGGPDASAQPGHSDGGGPGKHDGKSNPIAGDSMKSKANAKMNAAAPMPGVVLGRSAGKSGETANVQGTGALGNVGTQEVNGVERSEVPEEYREQVGRYFQPQ